jgi:hypothetical protein
VSEPVVAVPQEPVGPVVPFHDQRWRAVTAGSRAVDDYLCDECGVAWSL